MNFLGNVIFFVFGGFLIFLGYLLGGILLCLTIIGIPFGIQCFKLAAGVIAPFGREVRDIKSPDSTLSVLLNILWIILPGLELAIMHLVLAALLRDNDYWYPDRRATHQAVAARPAAVRPRDAAGQQSLASNLSGKASHQAAQHVIESAGLRQLPVGAELVH